MKYKFKLGEEVRIKPRMNLRRICMGGVRLAGVLTITDAIPGQETWSDRQLDGTPTYTITGGWRVPEVYLEKIPEKNAR